MGVCLAVGLGLLAAASLGSSMGSSCAPACPTYSAPVYQQCPQPVQQVRYQHYQHQQPVAHQNYGVPSGYQGAWGYGYYSQSPGRY
jgi:hypothetical protein